MIVLARDLGFGAMLATSLGDKPGVVRTGLAEGALVTIEPGRRRPLRR